MSTTAPPRPPASRSMQSARISRPATSGGSFGYGYRPGGHPGRGLRDLPWCQGSLGWWSLLTSGNVGVNINSSYPTGDTTHVWNAYMNNNSATDTGFIVYAECAAKSHLYGQSFGDGTSNPSSEDDASGTCVRGSVTTGGGVFSSSSSIFVNLNSTEPVGNSQWRTWINNNTGNLYSFSAMRCVSASELSSFAPISQSLSGSFGWGGHCPALRSAEAVPCCGSCRRRRTTLPGQ